MAIAQGIRVLIWGLAWEGDRVDDLAPGKTAEEAARAECEATWGTSDGCLVVDVAGQVMLNTAGLDIAAVTAT